MIKISGIYNILLRNCNYRKRIETDVETKKEYNSFYKSL